jgi:hypothetical protein
LYVKLDVKRSNVPFNHNTMDIYFTLATKQATYHFVVNTEVCLARVTKLIRKGQKGYDCSTTMSPEMAHRLVDQLQAK